MLVISSNPTKPLSIKSLDSISQLFYRNLEGDNMLATEEFVGRVRPIETPITLIAVDSDFYILANMPYVKSLIDNPTDWMFGFYLDNYTKTINSSIKILSVQYIGSYDIDDTTYTNCCKITLNKPSECPVGRRAFICSFLANGLVLKWDCAFKASGITTRWDGQITEVGASWKCSDGTYRALVSGYGSSLPSGSNNPVKLFSAQDRLGSWVNITGDGNNGVFDDIIPEGYTGMSLHSVIRHPHKVGMFLSAIPLKVSDGTHTKISLLEFNEYLTYKKIIDIDINYEFGLSLSSNGYGVSIAFYKGKYLISIHDGTHNTGKRVILSSKWLEGEYSIHSTIFDFSSDISLKQKGSVVGGSIPNSALFVFNNELYCIAAGQGVDLKSGLASKLQYYLFKFDDSDKSWSDVKGPVILGLHGDNDNYPEYPGISRHEYDISPWGTEFGGWGKGHCGATNFHYIEGSKLWFGYCGKGWGNVAPANNAYHATIGYIDLNKALS